MSASRFTPGSTWIYGVLWLAVVIQGWSPLVSQDAMLRLYSPADSVSRKTSRDLELAEAIDRAPALERSVLRFWYGSAAEMLEGSIGAQQQVLAHLEEQGLAAERTRDELAILLAEAGESEEDLPGTETGLDGWYADARERQQAIAAGDLESAARLDERIGLRGLRWKRRSVAVLGSNLALVAVGLVLILSRVRLLRGLPRGGPSGPAWSFGDGIGVFVRGEFWNRSYFLVLYWLLSDPHGAALAAHPVGELLQTWGTLFGSLPLLWLVHRHLLAPHGASPIRAFGLNASLPAVLAVGLGATAIDLLGTHALGWATWGLGVASSWAEGFDESLVWGTRGEALMNTMDYVLWTPAMEELAFRGVLYYSLRHHLGPMAAALATGGFFAGLHFYSLPGFLMTAWSGIVWALAFERLRSLLPGVGAHAVYNVLYVAGLVLLYR